MQHITVPLPDGIAPTVARRIAVETEAVVNRHTEALVDATVTDLVLTDQERRVIRAAVDVAIQATAVYGGGDLSALLECADLATLQHRIDPDRREAIVAATLREVDDLHRESRA